MDNFIGFTAHITSNYTTGDLIPIVFDAVYVNSGSGYDTQTGYFTCPVAGIYAFTIAMLTPSGDNANLQLFKLNGDGTESAYTQVHGDVFSIDGGTLLNLIQCEKEESVYVKAQYDSVIVEGYTTFSGFLLSITA